MLKKGLVIGTIFILMLASIPIAVGDDDSDRKHIVYIKGNNLYSSGSKINGRIRIGWRTAIYFSHITNFTEFNFIKKKWNQEDTKVTIIDNGKKEVYNNDVDVHFDLSIKISFIITYFYFRYIPCDFHIIAFCDDITVTEREELK
jgi:hypothetical protein